MKRSCVTWVPALWFGWTLKRRMRAGPGLMAIFLTRVPSLPVWCWFFIVSQAKLESLSTLQTTAPICLTGVNWFGLHWAWNFPEAAPFSWGWPRWKRRSVCKEEQGKVSAAQQCRCDLCEVVWTKSCKLAGWWAALGLFFCRRNQNLYQVFTRTHIMMTSPA